MSIRTKGRRRIIVGNLTYVWYVALDYDTPYNVLNIASDDKCLRKLIQQGFTKSEDLIIISRRAHRVFHHTTLLITCITCFSFEMRITCSKHTVAH